MSVHEVRDFGEKKQQANGLERIGEFIIIEEKLLKNSGTEENTLSIGVTDEG